MRSDLGITVIVIHFADGRVEPMRGGYLTSLVWSLPGLLWGAWRYLGNDNVTAAATARARARRAAARRSGLRLVSPAAPLSEGR